MQHYGMQRNSLQGDGGILSAARKDARGNERFWFDEAQTWTERLKAKNAFWHEFAENPELPGTYHGSDR
jgi:hypothetical protein